MNNNINKDIWENKYKNTGDPFHVQNKYDQELINIKVRLIKPIIDKHKLIVDIGCGTGDYLIHEIENFEKAIGIDFSKTMINQFSKKIKEQKINNIILYKGEAKNIPIAKGKVDFIFSYATLYYIPNVEEVLIEINRALKPGGIAVLEFGNSWSLEYLLGWINHKIFGWSKHYCINYFKMNKLMKKRFKILGVRRFQFIPVASLPTFLSKILKYILRFKIYDKMIDEWISGAPILDIFSYRNIYIVQKYNIYINK
jgi:ubiquinone/menaquinone biosynthesis C-methylase UbiE